MNIIQRICRRQGTGAHAHHLHLPHRHSSVVPAERELELASEFTLALAATPQIVQDAFAAQTERWNTLLFRLADLAGGEYNGETSDELVERIAARLSP